ncbi:MAG: sugar ABC transporter permease [Acholeplasmataceae bacterium]|jgi:ABC-type sugar transport system permease subunit|nr:sugar ABC transporter permease [Acholeplasmataceae bacterium]
MEQNKAIKAPKVSKLKYKHRKVLWGIVFLLPWFIGFVTLFLYPFVQSFYYSFFTLKPEFGAILKEFVGFDNYIFAFREHVYGNTSFKLELYETVQDSLINLLVLLIFSLFIAVLLNHEFRGRAIVRAIFFIPVILNSAAVTIALGSGGVITDLLLEESAIQLFALDQYLLNMGIGTDLVLLVVGLIDRIYNILTLAGVPILLFLAAIQSVPKHLYEAATIEGATGYEMFWLITLPNVSVHIVTVTIYAIVDSFLTSSISNIISSEFSKQKWGLSSAMAWIYVGTILTLLLVLFLLAKVFKIGESHYEKD